MVRDLHKGFRLILPTILAGKYDDSHFIEQGSSNAGVPKSQDAQQAVSGR